jgi:heme-degrading monooxygenase HmoA
MVITIFKVRMKPGVDTAEYSARVANLLGLARKIPGFKSINGYRAEDGEELILIEFDKEQALKQWREHPEHLIAQELGRSTYYAEYQIQICSPIREYSFKAPTT